MGGIAYSGKRGAERLRLYPLGEYAHALRQRNRYPLPGALPHPFTHP